MAECPGTSVLAEAADGLVARLRVPGGRLGAAQLRGLAALAERLGNGTVDLTNRANLQIRGLTRASAAHLPASLGPLGLWREPAVDRRRNILADPLAGLDPGEALDVTGLVAALDRALVGHLGLAGLSPKFSFALDGGGRSGTLGQGHDVGVRAERVGGAVALRLSLAGRPTDLGLPPGWETGAVANALAALAEAAARLGPTARMRDLLARDGSAGAIALVERLAGSPPLPLPSFEASDERCAFFGPIPENQTGLCAFGLGPAAGALDAEGLAGLADLAEAHGGGELRLTWRRSVLIPHVADPAALEAAAHRLGFLTGPAAVSVVACAGRSCARGNAAARQDGAALARALAGLPGPATVHISGCARGCAFPRAAEIVAVARRGGSYDLFCDSLADAPGQPAIVAVPPSGLEASLRRLLASAPLGKAPRPSDNRP